MTTELPKMGGNDPNLAKLRGKSEEPKRTSSLRETSLPNLPLPKTVIVDLDMKLT